MEDLLDWHNFKNIHVVPSGKIQNNRAEVEESEQVFSDMWKANKFDNVLYTWVRAVYLARLACRI